MASWDHILLYTPDAYGGSWRLECAAHGEHFTADVEEWDCTARELEANGVTVDWSTCWVHDWIDNGYIEEWMIPGGWSGGGPWLVSCWYSDGLRVEYVGDVE